MKRFYSILLALCMLSCLALPIAAKTTPFDPSVSAVMSGVSASVGADTAGAAAVVYKNGAVVMADGFGYADLGAKTLVTSATVFEIGDLSALFVTLSALQLGERGLLSLDADIAEYLSADLMAKLALTYPVTVRQLLAGTAGFGGRIFDLSFDKQSHTFETLEEALLADVPSQIAVPGTVRTPSPFGVTLAAMVVEVLSGVPYDTYVSEQLLAPLAMTNTLMRAGKTPPTGYSVGYTAAGEGNFTDAEGGKTYSGLYPATGALSTAGDLSRLIAWLFGESDAVLSKTARAAFFDLHGGATKGATACFGASLVLDAAKREAVLVLTNTAASTLLRLPETLLPVGTAVVPFPEGEMLEIKDLRGTYAPASLEQRTFVGRYLTTQSRITVTANDDGTLTFGEMRLVQIARGVFADAAGDATAPVLQFFLDAEGNVLGAVTREGEVFTKLPFYYTKAVSTLLAGLLLLLTGGFILLGAFALFEWFTRRQSRGDRLGVLCFLPELLSALLALFVGAQLLLAYHVGTGALSSVYFALRVLALLAGLGATVVYVLAFVLTVLDRAKHHRIAYSAFIFLGYVFLVCFLGLAMI